ncbi:uncharacterized protein UMAG_10018 [Mycosarcoma maydis]|uniref:EXS domain-containing protein n=1 Tax=Mycosarcoma maydis TaxID=5270 RepID=A0A0D1E846_MYCMD|nr:uncharacterized protein UMAG_10018 [Ustilago maydis 521]KIS71631.1 hypothetical protein UMAG_10018 [Ustilago maydis 521]|eukprot:XP_011386608.1 hypothetical protein UMAG_10018 [Ustilago maydis 521]
MSDPGTSAPSIGNDPIYDDRLWSFSAFFPPPYRVLLLASLGLLLFAMNVLVLESKGIDLFALFRADAAEKRRPIPSSSNGFHRSTTGASTQYGSYHNVASSSTALSSSENRDAAILPMPNRSSEASASAAVLTARPLLAFGALQLFWSLLGWASYRFYVDSLIGDPKGRHAQALQAITVTGAFAALLWPGNLFFKPMRKAFGRSICIIFSPSLTQPITFSDVILADILTSFAKVLGDVWLTACFLVPRKEHHTWWNGKGSIAVPVLISLPYAIRFRQCLSEYVVSRTIDNASKNKRALWNAAKYASALPVIWLSAWYEADKNPRGHQGEWVTRYMLWFLAVCVNSIFSFWWDVTNDWGLSLLQPSNMRSMAQVVQHAAHIHRRRTSYMPLPLGEQAETLPMSNFRADEKPDLTSNLHASSLAVPPINTSSGPASSHGRTLSAMERLLRPSPSLLFPGWMYQCAILLDLLLRFFWSLKLSSHLHHLVEWQGGMFSMELLEILRRWIWVFFRVEWEVVRRRESARSRAHVAMD